MTSMIDVVFLLLIFFVVTTSAQLNENLLPAALTAPGQIETPAPVEDLRVEIWLKLLPNPRGGPALIDMNGAVYSDRREWKAQLAVLAELGPENPIVMDIAEDVELGDVVDVYDACRSGGFESVNFAAESPATVEK